MLRTFFCSAATFFVYLCLGLVVVSPASQAAIFGQDDRMPILPNSVYAAAARSTAIAVPSTTLTGDPQHGYTLETESMSQILCSNERFVTEPYVGYSCSLFLVGSDLMVSAGHCFALEGEEIAHERAHACSAYSVVFDFQRGMTGTTPTENISPDRVYHCQEIVYAIHGNGLDQSDFAIIRLDRPALDRKPLTLASQSLQANEMVKLIGYPLGTPVKVAGPAKVVRDNPKWASFRTRLNAFDGNSGSSVFNPQGQVIGILIGGHPTISLVKDPVKQCVHLNRCTADGKRCLQNDSTADFDPRAPEVGYDVQRIGPVIQKLNEILSVALFTGAPDAPK